VFDRLFRRGPSEFKLTVLSPDSPAGASGTQAPTTLQAQTKESVLVAALNAGLAFPHNCRVGGCGECKCRLVQGKVKELTDKSYLLSAEELQQNYILACQSQPRSDLVIEVALRDGAAAHPVVATGATIVGLAPLTHDVMHLRLKLDQPMGYTAGQYADISVPEEAGGGAAQTRSYSFATASDAAGPNAEVDFFVRHVPGGTFTDWLFTHAHVGSSLKLQGPHGTFQLHPGSSHLICIAGGSGLAPIKALLEQALADKEGHRHLVLVFGARTQADLYALDAIDQIRRGWTGRFSFVPVLSNEPAGSDWTGLRGLIHEQLGQLVGNRANEAQAYLCGPPQMIDASVAVLQQLGVPGKAIFADKFLDRSSSVKAAA